VYKRQVAALAGYLIHATGAGAKALSWLGERFEALKQTALAAWQGISDALAAGDIGLAARILWLTLKVEWRKGVNFLREHWTRFKEFFMSVATDAFYGVVKLLAEAWAGLQTAWVETVTFLANTWTNFTSGLKSAWESAVGWLAKGMLKVQKLFDKELDVEAAISYVEEETNAAKGRIERERKAALAEGARKRTQRLGEIETERAGTQEAIGEMAAAEHAKRRTKYAAELKKSEDALEEARKEWREAIAEAAGKRKASEKGKAGEPERLKGASKIIEDLKAKLSGVGATVEATVKRTVEVRGTFSAEAARALGAGGMEDRIAKATEDTAANTKKLLDEAKQNGLAFT